MSKKRFQYIDALRGLAIAGVIVIHAAQITSLSGPLKQFALLGSLGVQLFFVISAFTIFHSLDNSSKTQTPIRDFFVKRLFRIVPVYWFGIILYTIAYGLESRGWKEGPELWHYPMHFFLLNVLHPSTSSSVVPGGWSISCEVLFYAIVPMLFNWVKNIKNLIILIITSTIIFPQLNYLLSEKLSAILFAGIPPSDIKEFWYRWMPNQLGCFSFGILLFHIIRKNRYTRLLSHRGLNLFLILAIITAMLLKLPYKIKVLPYHYGYSSLFMCLALLLSERPWGFIVNRLTVFFGKISYSCYLIHFLVLKQVRDLIQIWAPEIAQDNLSFFFTVLILSVPITAGLAYLSYNYIEKSAISAGRKLIDYLDGRAPKPVA